MSIAVRLSPVRPAMQVALLGAMLSVAITGHAQTQDIKYGQVGPFTIHKIMEKGKFDRCAATLQPGPNMLRIAWNKDHVYTISVPTAPRDGNKPYMLKIDLGRGGQKTFNAQGDAKRSYAVIDAKSSEHLLTLKQQIVIDIGKAHYVYPIGNVSMEAVMGKLEDCTWKAHGR